MPQGNSNHFPLSVRELWKFIQPMWKFLTAGEGWSKYLPSNYWECNKNLESFCIIIRPRWTISQKYCSVFSFVKLMERNSLSLIYKSQWMPSDLAAKSITLILFPWKQNRNWVIRIHNPKQVSSPVGWSPSFFVSWMKNEDIRMKTELPVSVLPKTLIQTVLREMDIHTQSRQVEVLSTSSPICLKQYDQ